MLQCFSKNADILSPPNMEQQSNSILIERFKVVMNASNNVNSKCLRNIYQWDFIAYIFLLIGERELWNLVSMNILNLMKISLWTAL